MGANGMSGADLAGDNWKAGVVGKGGHGYVGTDVTGGYGYVGVYAYRRVWVCGCGRYGR
jgi:hypothetical protein